MKEKGLSDEELKRWAELKEQTKGVRRKARQRAILVFTVALLLGVGSTVWHMWLFVAVPFGLFLGGLIYVALGVVMLWGSMVGQREIALMCMARREDDPRVFAELEAHRYYRMAGFGIVILGVVLQAVGLVAGINME